MKTAEHVKKTNRYEIERKFRALKFCNRREFLKTHKVIICGNYFLFLILTL